MTATMKRLFVLRHGKGGSIVNGADGHPMYFGSKPLAKAYRDQMGGVVVSRGPDNRNYKGA